MTAAIRRSAVVAGPLAIVCVAGAAFAAAPQFVKATPAAGSNVGSVTEVQLEFNESVDPRFSGLTLTAPHGVNVELGEP
jgi:methionine-rich copper-binding protein CopC